jgi:hypothetical protein
VISNGARVGNSAATIGLEPAADGNDICAQEIVENQRKTRRPRTPFTLLHFYCTDS